jgi:hypothetical protein
MNLETLLQNETVLRCAFCSVLLLPILLYALAVWRWRGALRSRAAVVMSVLVLLLAMDVIGAIQGGNLAGIWTIIAFVPSLAILLVLAIVHSFKTKHLSEVHGNENHKN